MTDLPEAIGPYLVLERLGEAAAHAEVLKARDEHGTIVCVKRVHPSVCEDVEFVARFAAEIELAESLEHINVVRVSDHGEDGGHYLVMEWIDGVDLGALLRSRLAEGGPGALPAELVTYLGVELSRALSYLHRSAWVIGAGGERARSRGPVIHGDLSPSNVLLSRHGFVKLADFGLSRALGRTGARTRTEARGKPMYWAPEQFADEPIGVETDLFALGLVLWRALVGTQPYAEARPRGRPLNEWIAERTVANARRAIAEAAPGAPAPLQRAIEGLLQPVERRVGSAEELFEALQPVEPLDGHAQLAALVSRAAVGS